MIILIDIDNTINDLCEACIQVYNEDYNDNLTEADITDYYIEQFVKPKAKDNFYNYFTDKRVWKRIKPMNIEAVQWLIDNHEVYFLTSTWAVNIPKKYNWLSRQFKNIDVNKRLISCHNKQLVKGDYLLDDCLDNLSGGDYVGVCIAKPWNTSYKGLRFNTIQEFIDSELG